MKLTILGTGNALVTKCYNTCFILEDQGRCLLVDGGGGSAILAKIRDAGYEWTDIHDIFVTHKHVDHILGIIWMVRVICQTMNTGDYEGEAFIYGHDEVISLVREIAGKLLNANELVHLDERLHTVVLEDGDTFEAMGHKMQAFDIGSTKAKQFGFNLYYGDGKKLTCCGDEPFNEREEPYARDSDWMLHEAFCLYGEADIFHPYDHHHSTVREASQLAESLNVKNLVLYHTEDKNILVRKEKYGKEGAQYYHGNLYVPDDMDVIDLDTGVCKNCMKKPVRRRHLSSSKRRTRI